MSSSSSSVVTPKTVLITGATHPSSLGSAFASAFLNKGFRVIVTSQNPINRAAWLEEKGCEVLELELSDDASIVKLVEEVKDRTGSVLDVLINNASSLTRTPLLVTPIESLNHDWQTNIIGTFRLTQLLAPLLVYTAARPDRGRTVIFNIGTAGSRTPVPWMGTTLATKGALEHLSEVLRYEMKRLNVAVFCAKIGYVKTTIAEGEHNPFDETSPNAAFYPEFMSKTLKKAQNTTNQRYEMGSDPHEVARWVVGLCTGSSGGGIVWHASKAWIIRWIFPLFPDWAMDRILTASGILDDVRPPSGVKSI